MNSNYYLVCLFLDTQLIIACVKVLKTKLTMLFYDTRVECEIFRNRFSIKCQDAYPTSKTRIIINNETTTGLYLLKKPKLVTIFIIG